ncbi:MAG: lytic transglycosylase domain-containing protein [Deltaproteobacteria bacterium]|nr:MAG: lytic transglycosylase domain-containing protein [Deltaproteobacteria bacterium]
MCDSAAEIAAQESGVPVSVLKAVALTESGRTRNDTHSAWPWAVNVGGRGVWLNSAREAQAFVVATLADGKKNFDVGCFQINYRWHHNAFSSLEQMLEPVANARYAAKFLQELYAESGDWMQAVGRYHSRTPELAEKYTARFSRNLARVLKVDDKGAELASIDAAASTAQDRPPTRTNNFPFFRGGSAGKLGSLVPDGGKAPAAPLFDIDETG